MEFLSRWIYFVSWAWAGKWSIKSSEMGIATNTVERKLLKPNVEHLNIIECNTTAIECNSTELNTMQYK